MKSQFRNKNERSCLSYIILGSLLIFILYLIQELGIYFWIILLFVILLVVLSIRVSESQKTKEYYKKERLIKQERINIIRILKAYIREKSNLQSEYKNKIDQIYQTTQNNGVLVNALSNFMPRIPTCVLLKFECYTYFEYLIWQENEIGRQILWSSSNNLLLLKALFSHELQSMNNYDTLGFNSSEITSFNLAIEQHQEEIINFYFFDFKKFSRLLFESNDFNEGFDYNYVLLRMIQISAPSFISEASKSLFGLEQFEFEKLTLDESIFKFYRVFSRNAFNDPAISYFTYLMIHLRKFGPVDDIDYFNYPKRRNEIIELIKSKKEDFDYRIFQKKMLENKNEKEVTISIADIDLMSGFEFEELVSTLFTKMGFQTEVTKHTGDFGVDVIAEKDEMRIGIQAKCYSKAVTNSAIQEITAGMKYYDCQKGIVVTNSNFTNSAIKLAVLNSIQLWDRKVLEEKLSLYF